MNLVFVHKLEIQGNCLAYSLVKENIVCNQMLTNWLYVVLTLQVTSQSNRRMFWIQFQCTLPFSLSPFRHWYSVQKPWFSCPVDSRCKVISNGYFGSGRLVSLVSIKITSVIVCLSLGRSWTQRSSTCMHHSDRQHAWLYQYCLKSITPKTMLEDLYLTKCMWDYILTPRN